MLSDELLEFLQWLRDQPSWNLISSAIRFNTTPKSMIPQVIHHAQLGGPPLAGLSFSHRHKFLTSPRPPGRELVLASFCRPW